MSELYKLPAGWEWKKLDDVCSFVRGPFGGSLKKNEFTSDGYAVYEQSHAIYNSFSDIRYYIDARKFQQMQRFKILPNSIIMSCSGTIGKLSIVPNNIKNGIINQALLMLTVNNSLLNIYLKLMMESSFFQNLLSQNTTGAAIKNIASVKVLKNLNIPLPPLAEQKRIVAKLDSLFEKIDKAIELHQQNITNANTLMASTLDKTFKKLEGEYGNKTLSDSVENPKKDIVDGPFGSNLKATEYIQKGVPIIRIQNIQRLEFINKDIKFVSEEKAEFLKRHSFIASDIVITKLGEPLGKSCIVPDNLERGIIVADIIRVRVDSSKSKNKYIMYAINSAIAINQFSENSMGSTRQRVKLSIVRDLKIPLPPLAIQQQTVEYLDSIATKVDKIKQLNEQKLENLKALKASILDKAFRGEL